MPTRLEETSGLSIVSMLLFIYHKKFEGLKLFDLQLREYIFFSFTVFFLFSIFPFFGGECRSSWCFPNLYRTPVSLLSIVI